jgi:hypothetical protein
MGLSMRKARHHAESRYEFARRRTADMAYAKTLDCLCGNLYFFVDSKDAKEHTSSHQTRQETEQMTMPTVADAIAYVIAQEAAMGNSTTVLWARPNADYPNSVDVQTENYWTVWYERDGMLYGEC